MPFDPTPDNIQKANACRQRGIRAGDAERGMARLKGFRMVPIWDAPDPQESDTQPPPTVAYVIKIDDDGFADAKKAYRKKAAVEAKEAAAEAANLGIAV